MLYDDDFDLPKVTRDVIQRDLDQLKAQTLNQQKNVNIKEQLSQVHEHHNLWLPCLLVVFTWIHIYMFLNPLFSKEVLSFCSSMIK